MTVTRWLAAGVCASVVIGCVAPGDVQRVPADNGAMVRDYPIDKIAGHTYVIHGPLGYFSVANQGFMNNPAFVVTAEGVVVIPAHLADEIADETVEMTAFEDFVTEEVLKGRSILGLYPATDERTNVDFAAWRQANGR